MPYKSYAVRKSKKPFKRYRKKPSWYDKKYSVKDLAKKAIDGVWHLKGLVNSEMYKLDIKETGSNVLNNGLYTVHLTAVAIGDTDSTRTGNSIYARSINIRGQCVFNGSGTDPQFIRIAVVLDTQQIADGGPVYTDVYNGADYNAHLNPATVGRFKVLFSRVYALDSVNNLSKMLNINLAMRHHVRFNGALSTDIQKGAIYIIACSSETTNGPKIVYDSRLSYHDN